MTNFKYLLMIVVIGLIAWLLFTTGMVGTKHDEKKSTKAMVFSIHDSNKDGFLDKTEYSALIEKRLRRMHKKKIQSDNIAAPFIFEDVDTNKDLQLSEEELVRAIEHQRQQQKRHRYRGGRADEQ